jgi:hypothetical protein
MNTAANPLSRLAPRTRLHPCVYLLHQRSKDTPTGVPKLRIEGSLCKRSTVPSTRGHDNGQKGYLLNQETAFNIHNPSLDHRVR